MNADTLSAIVGVILSLAFAYIPGVKDWYDQRLPTEKAGLMALLLVAASLGIFAASCGQLVNVGITCDKAGVVALAQILIMALISNQGAYTLLVRPFQPPPTNLKMIQQQYGVGQAPGYPKR